MKHDNRLDALEGNRDFFEHITEGNYNFSKAEIVAAICSCYDWAEFWDAMDPKITVEELAEMFNLETTDNICNVILWDLSGDYADEVMDMYSRFCKMSKDNGEE